MFVIFCLLFGCSNIFALQAHSRKIGTINVLKQNHIIPPPRNKYIVLDNFVNFLSMHRFLIDHNIHNVL